MSDSGQRVPTYLDLIAQEIWQEAGGTTVWPPFNEEPLYLGYAVLALAKGEAVTCADVHNAWVAWSIVEHGGSHPSAKPFEALRREVREKDTEYRNAIARVARRLHA